MYALSCVFIHPLIENMCRIVIVWLFPDLSPLYHICLDRRFGIIILSMAFEVGRCTAVCVCVFVFVLAFVGWGMSRWGLRRSPLVTRKRALSNNGVYFLDGLSAERDFGRHVSSRCAV